MTLLADRTIRSRIGDPARWEPWQMLGVCPFRPEAVQPCSLDVHLAGPIKVYTGAHIDTRSDNASWWETLLETLTADRGVPQACWILQPGRLYLAVVDEWLSIPEDVCGLLHGNSTNARNGISLHQQAGLLDPGYRGRPTLEITVVNPHTVLYAGQRIGQVTFELLDQRCDHPYVGRYQDVLVAQPARPAP